MTCISFIAFGGTFPFQITALQIAFTHTHTHTWIKRLFSLLAMCSLATAVWNFKSGLFWRSNASFLHVKCRKSITNSRNINLHVHYFFNCVSGPLFSDPLEVKLCKAYLEIKHRPSLTLFLAPFSTHTSHALFSFPWPFLCLIIPPFFLLPAQISFRPTGPLSGAIES